jgi:hypothetical protein
VTNNTLNVSRAALGGVQRLAGIVVYRPPEPVLMGFIPDKTPHFVCCHPQRSVSCPRPAPVDCRKKYARTDDPTRYTYNARGTFCADIFHYSTKNAVCRFRTSRFSSHRHFRNADILLVLIPLSLIPVFLTVSIVAYFFSVANGYRPLPNFCVSQNFLKKSKKTPNHLLTKKYWHDIIKISWLMITKFFVKGVFTVCLLDAQKGYNKIGMSIALLNPPPQL